MRCIDADALIADLEYDIELDASSLDNMDFVGRDRETIQFDKDCKQNAIDLLKNAPTIEPERKKGKWIDGQCSICGCDVPAYIIDWKWQKDMDANFCPNCGAYMKGEQDESD